MSGSGAEPSGDQDTPGPREALLARAIGWFAEHGVGDTSLRTLAAGLGTSHRMVIYHFGSREGLLSAVVEAVELGERAALEEVLAAHSDPFEAGRAFWDHVADRAQVFAPLFFELSGLAIQGAPFAGSLRHWLATGWVDDLARAYQLSGVEPERAVRLARLSLGAARGVLLELAATGDRAAADAAMAELTDLVRNGTTPRRDR